jgi:hypothetical protein
MSSRKLVCIDDSVKAGMEKFVFEAYFNWVKKGVTYTVRQVLENDGIVTGVLLNEVHNFPIYQPLIGRKQEPAFRLDRFAELEDDLAEEIINELEVVNHGEEA